jgi:hypothetical protein
MLSDAHPEVKRVPVQGGEYQITVKPWTMSQRRELRPLLADLIAKVLTLQDNDKPSGAELTDIFLLAEDEIAQIVRATIGKELPCDWDDLWWEDLAVLAQAVWETSIDRGDGGGLAGKLKGAMGGMFKRANLPSMNSSTKSSQDLPSSPTDGEPTQKNSATA